MSHKQSRPIQQIIQNVEDQDTVSKQISFQLGEDFEKYQGAKGKDLLPILEKLVMPPYPMLTLFGQFVTKMIDSMKASPEEPFWWYGIPINGTENPTYEKEAG